MEVIKVVLIFAMISSAYGVTISCFYMDYPIPFITSNSLYACTVVKEIENVGEKSLTGVSGSHKTGKGDANVNVVNILDCKNINFVPKKMQEKFSSLVGIHLEGCAIETLNTDDLSDYQALLYFGITGSNIQNIPSDFFKSTPMIMGINFSDNKISRVDDEFLKNLLRLNGLSWANFGANSCVDDQLLAEDKASIPGLVDKLREKCYVEPTTTTSTTTTSSTTTNEPNGAIELSIALGLQFFSLIILFT